MSDYRLVDRVDDGLVRRLAGRFGAAHPSFDVEGFVATAMDGWPDTLLPRIRHVTDALEAHLPHDWWPVAGQVVAGLTADRGQDLGFEIWPLIELLGRGVARPDQSLELLRELGAITYPELGVRPFLLADLPGTLAVLSTWTRDPRPGVRRLASEACRPRLPWAPVLRPLVDDPTPALALLTALRDDDDHLTRNSVANHLNDISRDHPQVVLDVLGDWLADPTEGRRWIADHALRTLTKAGDAQALALLGRGPVDVGVRSFEVDDDRPAIGSQVVLTAALDSREADARDVRIEVAVHYVRASGGHARKVFRWWTGVLAPGEPWTGRRTQRFRDLSTRTHQPGRHRVDLLVNGVVTASLDLDLVAPDPVR